MALGSSQDLGESGETASSRRGNLAARFFSTFRMGSTAGRTGLRPLFWVSFAALFIEIMLVRWIGTEVRVFAYFQNLALIACFLGFGLGCYRAAGRKILPFDYFAIGLLVLVVYAPIRGWNAMLESMTAALSFFSDAAIWNAQVNPNPGVVFRLFGTAVLLTTALLILLIAIMIPLGQWVGAGLDAATDSVRAYSVNLLGSVAGIWLFAGLSFLRFSPAYWFGLALVITLMAYPGGAKLRKAGIAVFAGSLVLLVFANTRDAGTFWSPYQKIELTDKGEQQYEIRVNNVGYMTIANFTPEYLARHPELACCFRERSSYDMPFRFAAARERVLIIGSGAGNDAAAALRNGAGHVDAVEIDPVILSLGERLHPEQPYESPRVRKVVQDARAFLRREQEQYDVIVFGLLDSHTQFSSLSNMRIDNYVYTAESFREARRLLKPNGILVVKFEVREPWTWLGQRFYGMLSQIFGRAPVTLYAPQYGALLPATVFVTSDDPALWTRAAQPELAELIRSIPPKFPLTTAGAPPAATDDWPYVYHQLKTIPKAYLTVSAILLLIALLLVRGNLEARSFSTWHFFFLGGGFLLLETQMISRLALYFGSTWLVNCVALTAILLVLVGANLFVSKRPPPREGPFYALLVAGLLANYFFPWQRLPYGTRAVGILLSVAYALPVFCAGVIFAESFRRCDRKSNAFGGNIVGAVAGGLTQNFSFIIGMNALLLLAVVFYATACMFGWLETSRVAAAEVSTGRAATVQ
jgi:SAM-dependent methyltransferase